MIIPPALRHLTLEGCTFDESLAPTLKNLFSLSDGIGDFYINGVLNYGIPSIQALRLKYHDIRHRRHDWPRTVSSLCVINNEELEMLEDVFVHVTRLHTRVSPDDLRFLNEVIGGDDSPLKILRLTMRESERRKLQDDWKPASEEEWTRLRDELEENCRLCGIQVSFHAEEEQSAVEFWEACYPEEEFLLQGF